VWGNNTPQNNAIPAGEHTQGDHLQRQRRKQYRAQGGNIHNGHPGENNPI